MGIVLASNFDVKTNLALDSRTNKNTIEERNAIPTEVRFEGLECYVKEDGGLYRLTGGVENSNWSLIPYTDADGNLTIDGDLILNNSSTPINIKEYIDTLTAAGIHYIGTLDGTESSPGSFTPAAEVGDMYIVSTAGYINGVEVEVGDSILCHIDTEAADSGTYTSINSNWNYVQANISTMRGATSDTPGMSGIVPIPSAGSENKYLKGDGTWSSIAQSDVTDLVSDLESKADKQTPNGGFAAGSDASTTTGGAVGFSAFATNGGAVGSNASATLGGGAVGMNAKTSTGFAGGYGAYADNGGAVGANASTSSGGAVGYEASATSGGGAVGSNASATNGGAVGSNASATYGGAVGMNAKTSTGFAGGASAKTVDGENNGIDAIQLGSGTNSTAKTLQVYNYQLMDSTGNIPLDRIQSALDESGISGGQETAHTHANKDVLDGISSSDITNWNNKADKQNSNGGFAAGNGASATSGGAVGREASATSGGAVGWNASANQGGAVGYGASTVSGGAVGDGASATIGGAVGREASATSGGGAVGDAASATSGGAVGDAASATSGGAVGYFTSATFGGAVGHSASADQGGAVGYGAKTSDGFAGGYNAKTIDDEDNRIDAIQLGTGTNSVAKTLQVYEYQLMDANGNIPKERLKTSNGGFAAGNNASTTSGGAVGSNAKETDGGFAGGSSASATSGGAVGYGAYAVSGGAVGNSASAFSGGAVGLYASATTGGAVGHSASSTTGGAVGYNAKTSTGFAGGYNAKTQDSSGDGIDAIQLGTGTNSTAKTLQVYEYQLMDANGNIPKERLDIPHSIDGINLDSAVEDMVHFAYCSTSGSTAAKTVTVNGFTKINGSKVAIYFSNTHTASSITLNVNNTGASSIRVKVGNGFVTIPGRGLVSGRIYYFIYYSGYYYLLNPNIIDGYDAIYGPSINNSNFKWLISSISSGKPSFISDKILLSPGLYSFSSTGYSTLGSNIYVKGYTPVNKDIASESGATSSTKYSVIDCDTGSSTSISQYKYNSSNCTALFENIIFNYTILNGAISDDSELFDFGNYNCKVKFKNCQFNFDTYKLISINSGSLEFENCSFYTTIGDYDSVCSRIVNQSSGMSYPLNVSFKNCKIDFARDSDYLMRLYGSSNYETNLIVENCDISAGGIYESATSNSNYIRNISILNNNINPIYKTGNSVYIYSDGNFIFSGNTVTGYGSNDINLNISSRRSIVTNNVFSNSVNVNYRQYGINQNIFSHNILCGECTLNGAGKYSSSQTANSNITAIGNSGFNPIVTSGFGTVHQAYNNYNA